MSDLTIEKTTKLVRLCDDPEVWVAPKIHTGHLQKPR